MGGTFVLGLNAYHGDASACLLRDGVPVAERLQRVVGIAGGECQCHWLSG